MISAKSGKHRAISDTSGLIERFRHDPSSINFARSFQAFLLHHRSNS
jgi:hypothetical protein